MAQSIFFPLKRCVLYLQPLFILCQISCCFGILSFLMVDHPKGFAADSKISAQGIPSLPNNVSYAPIVELALPGVVDIFAVEKEDDRLINPFFNDPFFEFFFRDLEGKAYSKRERRSSGSAVIISKEGLLITCSHIIQNSKDIKIRLSDGREFKARILKIDQKQDLALLKIETPDKINLSYLPIGDSSNLKVGDKVLAIGNSFGLGQTVTEGIISALSRPLEGRLVIQTNAAINPGNSGGALIRWFLSHDDKVCVELIGVPNAILSRSGAFHGVGFAIPSVLVKKMVKAALDLNDSYPWLGIYAQSLTDDLIVSLNERNFKGSKGVIVTAIHPKSAALKNGLKKGDVILSFNNNPVLHEEDFNYRQYLLEIGEDVALKIWRNGEEKNIIFKVSAAPNIPLSEKTVLEEITGLKGIEVANSSPALAKEYDLDERKTGVVVIKGLDNTSQLFRGFSLKKGDYLIKINDMDISSVGDLKKLIAQHKSRLVLEIERDSRRFVLHIQ